MRSGAKPALAGSASTLTWSRPAPLPGLGEPRQPLGERHRIDRLDDLEQLEGPAGLVALELAHQVPLDVRQWRRPWPPPPGPGSHPGRDPGARRRAQPLDRHASWTPPRAGPSRGRARPRGTPDDAVEDGGDARRGRRATAVRSAHAVVATVAGPAGIRLSGPELRRRKAGMSRSSTSGIWLARRPGTGRRPASLRQRVDRRSRSPAMA